MTFKPKFFYEAGAGEGGGAAPADTLTDEQIAEQQKASAPPVEVPKPIITDEELKGYGFDSQDAFKTFLAKHKEESIPDEEKKEKANIEKADFLKFGAENKLLQVEEYNQYETLKSKNDKDLVFENFLTEFKAEHPEITDPEELTEAATEDFNFEYKINSSNETAKKKAEAKIAKEAKELRTPLESKVTSAQAQYKETNSLKETYPKFDKFVDELITKVTPDKLAIVKVKNGEEELPIEIEITKEDRAAMAKAFKTPKSFRTFLDNKPEDVQTTLNSKMNGWLIKNKSEQIAQATFDLAKGLGVKSGSDIGATQPFAIVKGGKAAEFTGSETLEESNARLAQARQQAKIGR